MTRLPSTLPTTRAPDWEVDFYSRPVVEPDGKKRWELLICSTPEAAEADDTSFRWVRACPAASVNSLWLREALQEALLEAERRGWGQPRRLRCWRGSMRTMIQRAAEPLGMELVPSRRCYALMDWLQERQNQVYPDEPGYLAGPLPPPPTPIRSAALPLPEAVRGDSWSWAHLPLGDLREATAWTIGFSGLLPVAGDLSPQATVPGIRLFSRRRSLAIAGWLAGMEPVRLEIDGRQLVLEAGMEDRWVLGNLPEEEARAAEEAFARARQDAGGLQFLAVQSDADQPSFEGFWMMRDLPDG